jgi:hypothetical protein
MDYQLYKLLAEDRHREARRESQASRLRALARAQRRAERAQRRLRVSAAKVQVVCSG